MLGFAGRFMAGRPVMNESRNACILVATLSLAACTTIIEETGDVARRGGCRDRQGRVPLTRTVAVIPPEPPL
jgi:hypothetical protein